MAFEDRSKPLLSRSAFVLRVLRNFSIASAIVAVSLLLGMIGYHHFEQLNWIDAFANASMILSGMGPICVMHSDGGKIFAGCYALYSGLALVTTTSIVLAPLIHRLLHTFHAEVADD